MRSAIGAPPGSRVVTTSMPRRSRQARAAAIWVDFPAPSMPSRVMNFPALILCCPRG